MTKSKRKSLEETAKILAIPGARRAIREGEKQIKRDEFVRLQDLK